jgi:hypothetical protein
MSLKAVPGDLVQIALSRTDGRSFELFVNDFYPAIAGGSYAPLGGNKDGGADAFEIPPYEDTAKPTFFYQASIEEDTAGKIRRTVSRLREFGRDPRTLVYVTREIVRYTDRVEAELSADLDVTIRIRDGNYIQSHVNDGPQTISAFDSRLRHHTDFLKGVGKATVLAPSQYVKSPAVFVFLAQELNRRSGDYQLVDAMTDALVIWALEGTDPDTGILLSKDEVFAKIGSELPGVKQLVERRLQHRLNAMSAKTYPGGRAIRAYPKDHLYCLPWETRSRVEEESASDEALGLRFVQGLEARIDSEPRAGLGDTGRRDAAAIAQRAIQLAFEARGLEFASFLNDGDSTAQQFPTITEEIGRALRERSITGSRAQAVGEAALAALRGVMYDSEEYERAYLHMLSRTYVLLFTLSTEPRLLEYFQRVAGEFYLYVGSDVIIRALSEYLLPEADKMTQNTLRIAAQNGAKLILAEPVLGEVVSHLRMCDLEYRNHIALVEDRLQYELIRDVPHIMLRAYLYSHINFDLGPRRPKAWQSFVQKLCDYTDLHKSDVFDDIRRYLCAQFSMEYRSRQDLSGYVDEHEVASLTEALAPRKKNEVLAQNDAVMALSVYGRRAKRKEVAKATEFGLSTWWLTSETSILRFTHALERKYSGRFIMRPDFLVNFLTLAPKAADVRKTYENVFPSLLGISLSRRIEPEAFHKAMEQVAAAEEMDDARRQAAIAKIVDKLKSDRTKQFLTGPIESAVDRAAAAKFENKN